MTSQVEHQGSKTTPNAPAGGGRGPSATGKTVQQTLERYGLVLVFIALVAAFSIALPGKYFTTTNLTITLAAQSVILILALAETIPLRAGDFDLSVAAVMVGSASLIGVLTTRHGMPLLVAIALAVAMAVAVGAINALIIVALGVDAFIATLGTMTWLGGAILAFTHGDVLSGLPPALDTIANHELLGLPLAVFYGWALVLVLWYVYEYTPFGRRPT